MSSEHFLSMSTGLFYISAFLCLWQVFCFSVYIVTRKKLTKLTTYLKHTWTSANFVIYHVILLLSYIISFFMVLLIYRYFKFWFNRIFFFSIHEDFIWIFFPWKFLKLCGLRRKVNFSIITPSRHLSFLCLCELWHWCAKYFEDIVRNCLLLIC